MAQDDGTPDVIKIGAGSVPPGGTDSQAPAPQGEAEASQPVPPPAAVSPDAETSPQADNSGSNPIPQADKPLKSQAEFEAGVHKLGSAGNYDNPYQQKMVSTRIAGASWDQINANIKQHIQGLLADGAKPDQINKVMGFAGDPTNFLTMSKVLAQQHVDANPDMHPS